MSDLPKLVTCPRCRAAGDWDQKVVMKDGYGVCTACDSTWLLGTLDTMISMDDEPEAARGT